MTVSFFWLLTNYLQKAHIICFNTLNLKQLYDTYFCECHEITFIQDDSWLYAMNMKTCPTPKMKQRRVYRYKVTSIFLAKIQQLKNYLNHWRMYHRTHKNFHDLYMKWIPAYFTKSIKQFWRLSVLIKDRMKQTSFTVSATTGSLLLISTHVAKWRTWFAWKVSIQGTELSFALKLMWSIFSYVCKHKHSVRIKMVLNWNLIYLI
jgi:hypothetical protein